MKTLADYKKAYKALRIEHKRVTIDRDMWKLEFELLAEVVREKNEEIAELEKWNLELAKEGC